MIEQIAKRNDTQIGKIAAGVISGGRISDSDALWLFEHASLAECGLLANHVRQQKSGDYTFFNRNFHIEPTNVCVFTCNFCAYSRQYKNKEDGWELGMQDMLDKVKAYDGQPVTEVHIVGGVHPKMDLYFFADLLDQIRQHRPDLHIKAFTAVELDYMFRKAKLSAAEGVAFLKEKGLNSIPGGGAEIFDEVIRKRICADKCDAERWLEIHESVHRAGMRSNATILYGHVEDYGHRIDHMRRLRDLQDRTGGFQTFIPLKFRNKDNDMSDIPETSLIEDLKMYAVARIYLDNFDHIKAYWPMIGRSVAQLTQAFGVDDLDGTIDDTTRIYSMAGAEEQNPALTTSELVELIRQAGRIPVERDTLYNKILVHDTVETFS